MTMVRAPLVVLSLPVLTVLAICLYLRQRQRRSGDPPDRPRDSQSPAQQMTTPEQEGAGQEQPSEAAEKTLATKVLHRNEGPPVHVSDVASEPVEEAPILPAETVQVTCDRRVEEQPEPSKTEFTLEKPVPVSTDPGKESLSNIGLTCLEDMIKQSHSSPEPTIKSEVDHDGTTAEAGISTKSSDLGPETRPERETSATTIEVCTPAETSPVEEVVSSEVAAVVSTSVGTGEKVPEEETAVVGAAGDSILSQLQAAMLSAAPEAGSTWADDAEPEPALKMAEPVVADQPEADSNSENSSDSGKGGSSVSLEQASPSSLAESPKAEEPTVYDFLIPQKLCGRLIGKNGTFVNMLKSRTGASVFIRVHPVKTAVKICSVEGTQTEIDACLELIREKFPVQKFPAMTLERLTRSQEQLLAVPPSQQLHLPQSVTCDVVVSAVVCPGQLFLQQHTHPTFRGLHRLNTLMSACYGSGATTPQLPRPVQPSSICAAPVLDGWYRAQVVAYYPDTDQVDVRFMDYGGYSRLEAGLVRQIRTDFMSLPFQAEECYLANVVPTNDEGWTVEESAVLESLIADRALEAMVVGYAQDGIPFVNLYSIQGTEAGAPAMALINQQLVESGAARWVENQV